MATLGVPGGFTVGVTLRCHGSCASDYSADVVEGRRGSSAGRCVRLPSRRSARESPIRQGVVESPWERLVGGVILGIEEESLRVLKEAGGDRQEQTPVRRGKAAARPEWEAMVKAAEEILGQEWEDMILRHGDWGRDGLLAVATRHLGWRLGEVVEREPGVSYAAAAQGIRRFWKRAPNNPEMQAFIAALLDQLTNG